MMEFSGATGMPEGPAPGWPGAAAIAGAIPSVVPASRAIASAAAFRAGFIWCSSSNGAAASQMGSATAGAQGRGRAAAVLVPC